MADALIAAGAVVRLVGPRIRPFATADDGVLDADASLENHPAPLFDGVVVSDGEAAAQALCADGRAVDSCPISSATVSLLAIGTGAMLLQRRHSGARTRV